MVQMKEVVNERGRQLVTCDRERSKESSESVQL
jgi:hypothetical protein